jgi:hypothetical protein
MNQSDLDDIVEDIVRNTDKDDPYDIAAEVATALLARPKREAQPLVAEATMPRVLRHLRRLVTEDSGDDDLDPYAPSAHEDIIEAEDLDVPDDLPQHLQPFVDKTVRIPGVGLVRWGDVTLEQHLTRVHWIESKVGGLTKAKARHQDSIRYCRKHFANTLYEAIQKATKND